MTGARPLHVLALIDSLNWGGAERLLADLALGCRPAGVRLSVAYLADVHGSPAAARLRAAGVEPVLVPIAGLLRPAAVRAVRRHVARVAPDVVHTHLTYADVLGGLAARSLGIPAVATLHVAEQRRDIRGRAKAALAARVRRHCAGRVLAVSDSARGACLAATGELPARIVTVRNGTAARPVPGAGAAVRAELGIAPDELVAGIVTVLRAGKGHDVAIAATRMLRRRFPRLRLLVAGDGPAAPEVRRMAAALGDGAILTGHRSDVMELLDAVDVLVHPSRADALPTVLLEAMAAGVPIVASAVGGIPEIVEHGTSGILVDEATGARELAAAMATALADADLRRRLADGGRARLTAEFSAERWAERLRCAYDDVLHAHEPRAAPGRAPAASPPWSPT